jgi:MFS family permease
VGRFASPRLVLIPLALAQFLNSYDTQSMNVAISQRASDLNTTVTGIQTAISFYTLMMAAWMITGSKLSDIWGRKTAFVAGVTMYGTGAFITSLSPSLGVMFLGWSVLEGIGSCLMIPPIYILVTVLFTDLKSRAAAFGLVGAMGGIGAASGPLIGGVITTAITWRVSFALEVVVAIGVILLAVRWIGESRPEGPRPSIDVPGALLSAAAMGSLVFGVLLAGNYGWFTARQDWEVAGRVIIEKGDISPVVWFVGLGIALLVLFLLRTRYRERRHKESLIPLRVLRHRVANIGLVTQNVQWFLQAGAAFVVAVFVQYSLGYNAIKTGLVLTPVTVGLLLASYRIGALTRRFEQRRIVQAGFLGALVGIILLLLLVDADSSAWNFVPGLFLFGFGLGIALPASVNIVQSAMPEKDQAAISGVSRSVSNLGSSLGTAVAGAVLISVLVMGLTDRTEDSQLPADVKSEISVALEGSVAVLSDAQVQQALEGQPQDVVDEVTSINATSRNQALGFALVVVAVAAAIGLGAALLLPRSGVPPPAAPP